MSRIALICLDPAKLCPHCPGQILDKSGKDEHAPPRHHAQSGVGQRHARLVRGAGLCWSEGSRLPPQPRGTWNGQGKITGAEAGSVACRLTLRPSGERLNFNGRCTYSGSSTPQSFSGRISFNDRTGNWEASSRGDIVAGKKNGSTLTFVMSGTDMRGTGHSTLSLSPRQIKVDMQITRNGETSKGSIPFTKA